MSENYELLYAGFDTLYVAIQGALDRVDLDKLQTVRTEAQRTQTAQAIFIGPGKHDAQVHPSGQRGGFAYRLEAGPTDLVWSIKHSTDPRQWNLFAAAGSACLLTHGLDGVKAMIWRDLKAMGARWADHSINRIDFAMDFKVTGLELDYKRVLAHPHTGIRNYLGDKSEDSQIAFGSRGRQVESITIGKMPGRQVIIYDKRREAIKRNKLYWFDVWDIDPNDRSFDVYRVEFRAGKKHLKDQWQLSTFEDIENSIGDVFHMAAEKIRYLDSEQKDSNVSRQTLHPFWLEVQHNLRSVLDPYRCGLFPSQLKQVLRSQKIDTHTKLMIAHATGLAVSLGLDPDTAMKHLSQIMHDTMKNYLITEGEAFQTKFNEIAKNLRFVEDQRFDHGKYRKHLLNRQLR
ncbi:hypothetical protein [Govanella unica]|uniref:Uncharacterized protein n=1 Tax=Govanella unica TaxID=2975056 RepID=A0A9X3TYS5_9PROT|nr:hypothetical protein [Govania unica]MDA5193882.1 hypothetical protein [Govania unica]